MTSFSQSTQIWKWRVEEEERQRYAQQMKMRSKQKQEQVKATVECNEDDVIDLSADISWSPIKIDSDEESHDEEKDEKAMEDPMRNLSFFEKMKRLLPRRLLLRERMKDHTISYVDLLCPDPLPPKSNKESMRRRCKRLKQRKDK